MVATRRQDNDAHDAAFEGEHWLAWLFGAGSVLLGLLGLLRAFGVYGPENTVNGVVTSISPGGLPDTYWDGGLLLMAGLAAALLAFALHRNDHHRMRDLDAVPDREEGLWKGEHALAYLMAGASVVFAVIGLLTGYNKVGGHHWQPDGIPWLFASLGTAILANFLHSVRHHQMEWERHYYSRPATVRTIDYVQEPVAGYQEPAAGYRPDSPAPVGDPTTETQRMPRR
jgi:hypothetical protein